VPGSSRNSLGDDPANTVVFNVHFPGQYCDQETEFAYNRWRHCSPDLGRYISADPIGQAGGLNVYKHAQSNRGGEPSPAAWPTFVRARTRKTKKRAIVAR